MAAGATAAPAVMGVVEVAPVAAGAALMDRVAAPVVRLAERCVGARGLLEPLPFERLHRDLTHYLRQPAPDGALADVGRFVLEGKSFVS